jgi:phosphate transport system permease protein
MSVHIAMVVVVALSLVGFALGYRRAWSVGGGTRKNLHSLPRYHGLWVLLCMLLPAQAFVLLGMSIDGPVIDWVIWRSLPESLTAGENRSLVLSRLMTIASGQNMFGQVSPIEQAAARDLLTYQNVATNVLSFGAILLAIAGGAFAMPRIAGQFRARNLSELIVLALLFLSSLVAILTTVGIVFSLFTEALHFFSVVSPIDFFFGLQWSPQTAIRADQIGITESGSFGAIPIFAGTWLIAIIAIAVAVPIGLYAAIYMVEFAPAKVRQSAKPIIEILAGIPTVVYGFFAAVTVAPALRNLGAFFGLDISSESALVAGSVMGIMIIPFVSSLSDDVISAVPQRLREGAYMLGATKGETIYRVVLPAALPGLLSAVVLAVSRALGETMIVVMAAGLAANLTANPLEPVTTVTVQIASVLTGDQPFDSPTTLSAFALGLGLFLITFVLNLLALRVMEHYREKYD